MGSFLSRLVFLDIKIQFISLGLPYKVGLLGFSFFVTTGCDLLLQSMKGDDRSNIHVPPKDCLGILLLDLLLLEDLLLILIFHLIEKHVNLVQLIVILFTVILVIITAQDPDLFRLELRVAGVIGFFSFAHSRFRWSDDLLSHEYIPVVIWQVLIIRNTVKPLRFLIFVMVIRVVSLLAEGVFPFGIL